MKKKYLVWIMVGLCLSACTDVDDYLQSDTFIDETSELVSDLNSNVPIRFAPITLDASVEEVGSTRGSIDETNVTLDDLGLFCLAKYSIEGFTASSSVHTPSWSNLKKNELTTYSIWKDNEKVNVAGSRYNKGNIVWANEGAQYYPQNDWFSYGFVIYHPWTPYISYDYKIITAYIKVKGQEDVCFASAISPKLNELATGDLILDHCGFSKSFYEQLADADSGLDDIIYPHFSLEHLMSRIDLNFQLLEPSSVNIHVDKVEFDDFPCIMKLVLAKRYTGTLKTGITAKPYILNNEQLRTDSVLDGMVGSKKKYVKLPVKWPELNSAFGHFELRERNDEPISGQKNADGSYKYNLSTEPTHVGDCILIPPVYKGHSRENIMLTVTVADDAGNKYKCTTPVELKAPINGWGKGKKYEFTIRFYPPVLSGNRAEITDWEVKRDYDINQDDLSIGWNEVTE